MQPEVLRETLRAWGHATVNRYAFSRGDRALHALEHARDLAPGTKENALRQLAGRDGTDRRRLMASAAKIKGFKIVPTWAVDPVRASNDASPPHDRDEIAVDQGIPDHLRWVDQALAQMSRVTPLRALVVRMEFTVSASQSVKARMVREQYGGKLSVWQYRRELERALHWLDAKIAA
jgi:hypothetical protein